MTPVDIAIVLLRVVVGLILVAHGYNHVWGGAASADRLLGTEVAGVTGLAIVVGGGVERGHPPDATHPPPRRLVSWLLITLQGPMIA